MKITAVPRVLYKVDMQYKFATVVRHFHLLLQKKTLAKEKEPGGISMFPPDLLNRPKKPLRFSRIFPAIA